MAPDAALLAVLREALRDPGQTAERRQLHEDWCSPAVVEPMHSWQARAALEAIRPYLRDDRGTGLVVSVLVRRLGGDVLVTEAELTAIDGDLRWRQEPGGGLRIAHVPGDAPVSPGQINDAIADVLREVAGNG
jgi:hypothetical protein